MSKKIEEMTIKEGKDRLKELEEEYKELCDLFNKENTLISETKPIYKEINHGWCICVLDNGFIYLGELITDAVHFVIKDPSNIRTYSSGKGLLWHAENGPKHMVLDSYKDGEIKGFHNDLKHFIPTKKDLW